MIKASRGVTCCLLDCNLLGDTADLFQLLDTHVADC